MEHHFKTTIYLVLLVHTSNLVLLQNSTDSPRHTFDQNWLREQSSDAEEEEQNKPGGDMSPMEPSNDVSSVTYNEDNHMDSEEQSENKTDDLPVAITTEPPTSPNAPKEQTEQTNGTSNSENRESNHTHVTQNEEFNSLTTQPLTPASHPFNDNSTTNRGMSNRTDIELTTLSPEINNPNENTTSGNDAEPNNVTESATTTVTITIETKINKTSTTSSPKVLPSDPTKLFPEVTTTVAPETPEGNLTDKQASTGSSSERGFSSEASKSKRSEAWVAVLGTAVVVSIVGLVAYIILKRKHQKGFSHRKLVEVFPADPVLRLDNSEPLDLNFGGSAYYNPGLQGDSIQMSNIPGRKTN
ncbi:mucin-15 [Dunckerocampus dactyliophorus]|uniref:mucin-15 n=1 Tax=Dunckerocampus dactyliophorus TaxID=161453 RepID=UPI0024074605|nr:mucin-15 [Dunckerocampus dactyliophorus]XP_054627588.1 mucin-15 [Dunckerocampus dactyliophorus]